LLAFFPQFCDQKSLEPGLLLGFLGPTGFSGQVFIPFIPPPPFKTLTEEISFGVFNRSFLSKRFSFSPRNLNFFENFFYLRKIRWACLCCRDPSLLPIPYQPFLGLSTPFAQSFFTLGIGGGAVSQG